MDTSLLLCRLCIRHSDNLQKLYDVDGQGNEYYLLSIKYFGKQLEDHGILQFGEKHSWVICDTCWNQMNNFNEFHQSILTTQADYGYFIKNEFNIKTEMELELEAPFVMETPQDERILNEMLKDPVAPDNPNESNDGKYSTEVFPLQSIYSKQPIAQRKSARFKKPTKNVIREALKAVMQPSTKKEIKLKNKKTSTEDVCPNTAKRRERDAFIAEHMKNEFPCAICGQICRNMTEVKNHYRQLHDTQGYVTCCNRKFFHRIHLVDHINVHINSEYFKCEQCGKSSATRRSLEAHKKSAHSAQALKFECLHCHRKFLRASCLRIHLETHVTGSKDFVCEDCGKGFVLESRLKLHIRNVHAKPYKRVCELCGKSVQGRLELKKHLLSHEGIPPQRWPCNQCDAQLVSKYSLSRHKMVAHSDGSTVFVCSICGKCTKTADALRGHKRYAHQKKPQFQCKICQKTFKVSLTLREHMSSHTGEELYNCPHCFKTFRSSANMHHHRKRIHPKEWLEKHQLRRKISKIDLSSASNEVVL